MTAALAPLASARAAVLAAPPGCRIWAQQPHCQTCCAIFPQQALQNSTRLVHHERAAVFRLASCNFSGGSSIVRRRLRCFAPLTSSYTHASLARITAGFAHLLCTRPCFRGSHSWSPLEVDARNRTVSVVWVTVTVSYTDHFPDALGHCHCHRQLHRTFFRRHGFSDGLPGVFPKVDVPVTATLPYMTICNGMRPPPTSYAILSLPTVSSFLNGPR